MRGARWALLMILILMFVCTDSFTTRTSEQLQVTLIRTLRGHTDGVASVAFSPDGKLLASGSADDTVKLWEVETGQGVHTLAGHDRGVTSVAFSPDGKVLAASSYRVNKLWDVATGREVRTLRGHLSWVTSVAFSPDGRLLASGSWDWDDTIKLWDVATGQEVRALPGHSGAYVTSVAFSPDGRLLASASCGKPLSASPWCEQGEIKLWEVSTGKEVRTLTGHTRRVTSVAFSPDGRLLASGSGDGTIKLWEVAMGREIRTLSGHTGAVTSVAFSPDGFFLTSGSSGNTVKLWEVTTGRELRTLTGHRDAVTSVAFSPDGRLLASGSADHTIKLWQIQMVENQPPQAKFTFSPEEPNDLDAIQFTDQSTDPDGEVVNWHWDFGDGINSNEQNPKHQYRDDGKYTVKLTVTDDDGDKDSFTKVVPVGNAAPLADFSFTPEKPTIDDLIQFTDKSYDPSPTGYIAFRGWVFGDGTELTGQQNPTHRYTVPGTYTVTLTVIDEQGALSQAQKEIIVSPTSPGNQPPIANFIFSPAQPIVDMQVTFDASGSSDPDGHIVLYKWNFGDGSPKNYGMIVTHTFTEEGTYTVKLTVTDDDGATASTEHDVKILESGGGGGPA